MHVWAAPEELLPLVTALLTGCSPLGKELTPDCPFFHLEVPTGDICESSVATTLAAHPRHRASWWGHVWSAGLARNAGGAHFGSTPPLRCSAVDAAVATALLPILPGGAGWMHGNAAFLFGHLTHLLTQSASKGSGRRSSVLTRLCGEALASPWMECGMEGLSLAALTSPVSQVRAASLRSLRLSTAPLHPSPLPPLAQVAGTEAWAGHVLSAKRLSRVRRLADVMWSAIPVAESRSLTVAEVEALRWTQRALCSELGWERHVEDGEGERVEADWTWLPSPPAATDDLDAVMLLEVEMELRVVHDGVWQEDVVGAGGEPTIEELRRSTLHAATAWERRDALQETLAATHTPQRTQPRPPDSKRSPRATLWVPVDRCADRWALSVRDVPEGDVAAALQRLLPAGSAPISSVRIHWVLSSDHWRAVWSDASREVQVPRPTLERRHVDCVWGDSLLCSPETDRDVSWQPYPHAAPMTGGGRPSCAWLPPELKALLAGLLDEDKSVRKAAVDGLARFEATTLVDPATAAAALRNYRPLPIGGGNDEVLARLPIATVLWGHPGPGARKRVTEVWDSWMQGWDEWVRRTADNPRELAHFPALLQIAGLISGTMDADCLVARSAWIGLGRISPPDLAFDPTLTVLLRQCTGIFADESRNADFAAVREAALQAMLQWLQHCRMEQEQSESRLRRRKRFLRKASEALLEPVWDAAWRGWISRDHAMSVLAQMGKLGVAALCAVLEECAGLGAAQATPAGRGFRSLVLEERGEGAGKRSWTLRIPAKGPLGRMGESVAQALAVAPPGRPVAIARCVQVFSAVLYERRHGTTPAKAAAAVLRTATAWANASEKLRSALLPILDAAIERLRDADPEVRTAAAEYLVCGGPDSRLALVRAALGDPEGGEGRGMGSSHFLRPRSDGRGGLATSTPTTDRFGHRDDSTLAQDILHLLASRGAATPPTHSTRLSGTPSSRRRVSCRARVAALCAIPHLGTLSVPILLLALGEDLPDSPASEAIRNTAASALQRFSVHRVLRAARRQGDDWTVRVVPHFPSSRCPPSPSSPSPSSRAQSRVRSLVEAALNRTPRDGSAIRLLLESLSGALGVSMAVSAENERPTKTTPARRGIVDDSWMQTPPGEPFAWPAPSQLGSMSGAIGREEGDEVGNRAFEAAPPSPSTPPTPVRRVLLSPQSTERRTPWRTPAPELRMTDLRSGRRQAGGGRGALISPTSQ